jgi:hypothetical protein
MQPTASALAAAHVCALADAFDATALISLAVANATAIGRVHYASLLFAYACAYIATVARAVA